MIQLDIKSSDGHHTAVLENMLSHYCSAELIEFTCRNCNSTANQYQFFKASIILPSELILHIKRFSYNEVIKIHSKNMTPVIFPSELIIANCKSFPFGCDINATDEEAEQDANHLINMYPDYGHRESFAAPSSSFEQNLADFYEGVEDICSMDINTLRYRLTGVIRHKVHLQEGLKYYDPDSGHYVADTYDESRESSRWKRFYDASCTDTTLVLSYFYITLIYIAYNILNICCL